MNKETQNKCINVARIYIKNRFNNMSNENPYFVFNEFKLNMRQLHNDANELYATLEEFNRPNQFFKNDQDYKHHLIGKLWFFITTHMTCHNQLFINETVICDNYNIFARLLSNGYTNDDINDAIADYQLWLTEMIDDILNIIDENDISFDDVIEHINGYEQLNHQEMQFVLSCYYASLKDYKIERLVDGKYCDEVDYSQARKAQAVNDYCNQYNCKTEDLLIREIFDTFDGTLYTKEEFYNFCEQYNLDGCDIVLGFEDDLKTIAQWLEYTALTYEQLNDDLDAIGEDAQIINDNKILIMQLRALI